MTITANKKNPPKTPKFYRKNVYLMIINKRAFDKANICFFKLKKYKNYKKVSIQVSRTKPIKFNWILKILKKINPKESLSEWLILFQIWAKNMGFWEKNILRNYQYKIIKSKKIKKMLNLYIKSNVKTHRLFQNTATVTVNKL